MERTAKQNGTLHALITKLGIDEETKADLVAQVSEGRERSSRNLTYNECDKLIKHLQSLVSENHDKSNRMRRKILSICHEMKWTLPGSKLDWNKINNWLLKYGYLHKPLNDYTAKELPSLVSQFEGLLNHYYAKR
ncbi:MAG: hypothetical protein L6Q66_09180 [Bacteroidia bacterium]|nr:hypothetical protein [Bacteroidia bacterium]